MDALRLWVGVGNALGEPVCEDVTVDEDVPVTLLVLNWLRVADSLGVPEPLDVPERVCVTVPLPEELGVLVPVRVDEIEGLLDWLLEQEVDPVCECVPEMNCEGDCVLLIVKLPDCDGERVLVREGV